MSQTQEGQCTQLIHYDGEGPQSGELHLKEKLENGNTEVKIDTMKLVIMLHLNGEPQNALIMTVIRFILPSDNHTLKKLTFYFLEIIDKIDAQGKLLPEMILVCNFIRNDLQHPNEYVRGCALRFVCKIKEEELVEPLTDTIISGLDCRHSYVQRNALLAIFSVYSRFPHLLPDAPEIVEEYLNTDVDVASKRNAFIFLFNCAQDRAIRYLRKAIELDVASYGDTFQLAIVDLLRHLCKTNPLEKAQYLRVIFSLLSSKSSAVLFQCASTLLTLSTSPTAIRESASTFVKLLCTHGDNNVRLIVLDRLDEIKKKAPEVLTELLMDLLRALNSPNMDIRRRILELTMDLVKEGSVEKVVQYLKKEIVRAQGDETLGKAALQEYKQILVKAIHQCTTRHISVAATVLPVLADFVMDSGPSAVDVILFIREVMEKQPDLREEVIGKLIGMFGSMTSTRVYRITLWILGTYCTTQEDVDNALAAIKAALGEFPLVPAEKAKPASEEEDAKPDANETSGNVTTRTAVRADGTYVTTMMNEAPALADNVTHPFRALLTGGDFFLGTVLCNTLAKFTLRLYSIEDLPNHVRTGFKAHVMEIINEIMSMGCSSEPPIDDDSHERIHLSMQLLKNTSGPVPSNLIPNSAAAFAKLVKTKEQGANGGKKEDQKTFTPVDSLIHFSQFSRGNRTLEEEEEVEDVQLATSNQLLHKKSNFLSQLSRVMQLTGFSDPVFAEATVEVHQYDIRLDILVVNQSKETMHNLTLELATVGDLKLCERPQNYTLGPSDQINIKANIKVSSTETGIIFGNIVYDVASSANDRNCVILNDIHIDIMDYIHPANCEPTQFRSMWAEFEWENKVAVSTELRSLREYLNHIIQNTNMNCLTSDSSLSDDCDFLSANLYAKSSFGEDALANISIEKGPDGAIQGFVRIRSKTQGIALSLGDKITMKQRGGKA